jgi:uncharacterized protein YheU (UPF0270 family)
MPDDSERFVEIPSSRLSEETLRHLIEEFVTRDGTDYGGVEKTLEQKVVDVLRQLRRREAKIVFDTETQRANVVETRKSQRPSGAGG